MVTNYQVLVRPRIPWNPKCLYPIRLAPALAPADVPAVFELDAEARRGVNAFLSGSLSQNDFITAAKSFHSLRGAPVAGTVPELARLFKVIMHGARAFPLLIPIRLSVSVKGRISCCTYRPHFLGWPMTRP